MTIIINGHTATLLNGLWHIAGQRYVGSKQEVEALLKRVPRPLSSIRFCSTNGDAQAQEQTPDVWVITFHDHHETFHGTIEDAQRYIKQCLNVS